MFMNRKLLSHGYWFPTILENIRQKKLTHQSLAVQQCEEAAVLFFRVCWHLRPEK